MSKRVRDSNFSDKETMFLIECMRESAKILENKKTDSASNIAKKNAWDKIVNLFVENLDCEQRTATQLEVKWKRLKQVKNYINYFVLPNF